MPQPKKSRTSADKSLKYEPVPVIPQPCSLEDLETHLRGFIGSFIAAEVRERWLDYLIDKRPLWFAEDKPPRSIPVLHKADGLLNHFFAHVISARSLTGTDTFPSSLAAQFGAKRGVYFDLHTPPCTMTAAEAATNATEQFRDAILSLEAGKLALFFSHESDLWLCKR